MAEGRIIKKYLGRKVELRGVYFRGVPVLELPLARG